MDEGLYSGGRGRLSVWRSEHFAAPALDRPARGYRPPAPGPWRHAPAAGPSRIEHAPSGSHRTCERQAPKRKGQRDGPSARDHLGEADRCRRARERIAAQLPPPADTSAAAPVPAGLLQELARRVGAQGCSPAVTFRGFTGKSRPGAKGVTSLLANMCVLYRPGPGAQASRRLSPAVARLGTAFPIQASSLSRSQKATPQERRPGSAPTPA